jgi:hypothetical protein
MPFTYSFFLLFRKKEAMTRINERMPMTRKAYPNPVTPLSAEDISAPIRTPMKRNVRI